MLLHTHNTTFIIITLYSIIRSGNQSKMRKLRLLFNIEELYHNYTSGIYKHCHEHETKINTHYRFISRLTRDVVGRGNLSSEDPASHVPVWGWCTREKRRR